jgi:hypothetical protein
VTLPSSPSRADVNLPAADTRRGCLNCGETGIGAFCPACGQRSGDPRISVLRIVARILDDEFSLNARLPRSVAGILFRPGFLTVEYCRGRIDRYVRPLRLYLGSSVIFFLLLTLVGMTALDGGEIRLGSMSDVDEIVDSIAAANPSVTMTQERRDSLRADLEVARNLTGSLFSRDVRVSTGIPALDARIRSRTEQLRSMPPAQAVRGIIRDFLNRAPIVVWLLLPLFALFLKVLYLRSGRYYVEHLAFALHLHAFWFLSFTVMLLLRHPAVFLVANAWIAVYTYLAMRRVYGQGPGRTAAKYLVLGILYPAALAVGIAGTVIVSLAMG